MAGPEGLRACWLDDHPLEALDAKKSPLTPERAQAHLKDAIEQIEAYLQGTLATFHVTLAPRGTPFDLSVWTALRDIPFGAAISYSELAARCGKPKAFRAVGGANGRNPIPIIIPCHRVIGADGGLGGFSSGLERKKFMLTLEGVGVPS